MNLLPLKISAANGAWRKFYQRNNNPKFKKMKNAVLQRDQYVCKFCSFYSKEYQEVINLDNDYEHNTLSNMVTACSFCAQCFFLDSLGLDDNSGGKIIYLPEVTQADLNNFCRVLFCSMEKNSPYRNKLQATYMALSNRTKPVEFCFGPKSSSPNYFGRGLVDSLLTKDQLNHKIFNGLRLLPNKASFKPQINYWKETIFSNVAL